MTDLEKDFDWYETLNAAIQNGNRTALRELVSLARQCGVYRLQSVELHQAAQRVLEESHDRVSRPRIWLAERLATAGQQPAYPIYIALDVLLSAGLPCAGPEMARNTFRLIHDMVRHLLAVSHLSTHPRHGHLEKRVFAITTACQDAMFGFNPTFTPSEEILQLSLIPETSVPDELPFLRVVQSNELIFKAAGTYAHEARRKLSIGNPVQAIEDLHYCHELGQLAISVLGLLAPMTVEQWLELRPFIVMPSAIQSESFHMLVEGLTELRRIYEHPRYRVMERRYLSLCDSLIQDVCKVYCNWYKAHLHIAAKFSEAEANTSSKSDGVAFLARQHLPFCPKLESV